MFIDTGQHRDLIDTGAGAGSVPSAGKLLRNLQDEGVKPIDIDTVILTHGHPDHIGGNTDTESKPAFPNARYAICKDEWEFWMSEPDLAQLEVSEDIKQLMLMFAQKNLPPIRGQVDLVDPETEILFGILTVGAPGHIHLEHPDWYPVFDLILDQAISTRRQLLDRVVAENIPIMASHFPFPGLGYVIKKAEVWYWQPIEKTP